MTSQPTKAVSPAQSTPPAESVPEGTAAMTDLSGAAKAEAGTKQGCEEEQRKVDENPV